MPAIADTTRSVSAWIVSTWPLISSVARAVYDASPFTTPATTAKPSPASEARAAPSERHLNLPAVCYRSNRPDLLDGIGPRPRFAARGGACACPASIVRSPDAARILGHAVRPTADRQIDLDRHQILVYAQRTLRSIQSRGA
jgi:hypothetical protein